MSEIGVIGGHGFIGSHVADRLHELGHEVKIVDDLSTAWLDGNEDPRWGKETCESLYNCETIIHLGCRYPVERELPVWHAAHKGFVSDFLGKITGMIPLGRLKRVIVGSTLSVYNAPNGQGSFGSIAASLRQALAYLHRPPLFSVEFLHLPEVYGPRRMVRCPLLPRFSGQFDCHTENPPFCQVAHIDDVSEIFVQRVGAKPRLAVDLVVGGDTISTSKKLPVGIDIDLSRGDEGLIKSLEEVSKWYLTEYNNRRE